jgi:aldehyde dehydrogenase (NAD+)
MFVWFFSFLVSSLPFGGIGHSGMGVYHGKHGFDTFSHQKSVLWRHYYLESLYRLRYWPYASKKLVLQKAIYKG